MSPTNYINVRRKTHLTEDTFSLSIIQKNVKIITSRDFGKVMMRRVEGLKKDMANVRSLINISRLSVSV